jgi:threonine/homoserine/homoserine lactone efflux protein
LNTTLAHRKVRQCVSPSGVNVEPGYFLQGLLLGFSIAAPVGPIGVLCIRRTLADGRLTGFVSGLGAATADMFYGAVAAFGLTAVREFLVGGQSWLHLLGGLFLLYLGIRTFFTRPAEKAAATETKRGLSTAYLSTLGLTLTNPATIISFTFIFASLLPPASVVHGPSSFALVLGVFLGSAAWWLTLSGIVGLLRERFTPVWMVWVNRLAGLIVFGFGLVALFLPQSS